VPRVGHREDLGLDLAGVVLHLQLARRGGVLERLATKRDLVLGDRRRGGLLGRLGVLSTRTTR
jgi:hypothetical protein